MRRFLWLNIILTLALAPCAQAAAQRRALKAGPRAAQDKRPPAPKAKPAHQDEADAEAEVEQEDEPAETAVAAEPDVAVTLCVGVGDVVVRGVDKREVR
ncbi:MAG TPA: hypothetical protein VGV38_10810, partial [Pyrinomonadaceae bacterium]|nr:hypothetical protein [Pyrinomonadaceae bacterium]